MFYSSSDCLFGILCNVDQRNQPPKATSFTLPQSHLGNLDQKDRQLEQIGAKINYALCQVFRVEFP